MANLLDRASVVLTPTAYNNGEALCIKPDDASGDFQFSRNSAATRVNAQGLVENVQILSSNLVQNGDFSEEGVQEVSNGSFSQEGVEQVTNGDFATDSDWNLGSGINISSGSVNFTGVPNANINQNAGLSTGKTYKIVFTISNYVSGDIDYNVGGATRRGAVSGNGTYTDYVVSNTGTLLYFQSDQTLGFDGSIDNVSVREVGQDWTLATGWSIGEDKAIYDGLSGTQQIISGGASVVPQIGKTYKVSFNVLEQGSGANSAFFGGVLFSSANLAVGSYVFYVTATSTGRFGIFGRNGSVFSITNISVKEVGMDWVLNDWSVGDSLALSGNTSSLLQQPTIYTSITSIYKTTFRARSVSGASVSLRLYDGGGSNYETFTITSSNFQDFELTRQRAGSNSTLSLQNNLSEEIEITNISVIEITTDTNLPRINYEGFSYQDALGSEQIVNGSFDDGITGWSTSGSTPATVLNGIATIPNTSYIFQNALADGKQGKIVVSGNGSVRYRLGTNLSYSLQTAMPFTVYGTFGQNARIQIQNSSGTDITIDNVSVKEYLGQEVVPDSGCGSWLFEPQSSNLLTYSSDYNNSIWSKTGSASVTSNTTISPDGTQNADTLNIFSGNFFFQPVVGVGTFTLSCYVKVPNGTLDFKMQSFNGTDGANSSAIFVATTEWQRFEHTVTVTVNSSFYPIQVSGLVGGDFEIWGAQVEALSYATSYIPTEGSTVTRNQDVCNNGGSLASINSTEGTLYFEGAALSNSFDNDGLIRIGNSLDTGGESVDFRFDTTQNRVQIVVRAGGVNQTTSGVIITDTTANNKFALKYKANDIALWVNGIERILVSSASVPTGLDNISFLNFYSKTKAVAVWKEALSDSELQSLTTI